VAQLGQRLLLRPADAPLISRSAPAEFEGSRDSGMTSMRVFIDSNLVPRATIYPEFAAFGIALAAAGGAAYDLHRRCPPG